jgi:hypothetical protein
MVIQISPTLPCAQYMADSSLPQLCGKPTTHALITPDDDKTWELLPICSSHLCEVTQDSDLNVMRAMATGM